jgi:hypothetical protein
MAQNYTLGRGKLFFGRFITDTQTSEGERYIGNTPECSFTIETENLDHFSSDEGVREKDASVALETTRTGAFTTDNIDPANIAYFFFGQESVLSITGATITDEAIPAVKQGYYYQLGATLANPQGQTNLTAHTSPTIPAIVTDDAGSPVTFDIDDDWTINLNSGQLYIVPGGGITDGTNLEVDYKTTTQTIDKVVSGSSPVEGTFRFVAANPTGRQFDYFMPWVKITPNGDFALKGDEWQTIPFNLEILKRSDMEAYYVTSRVTPAA